MNKVILSINGLIIFTLTACGPLSTPEKEEALNGEPLESKQLKSQKETEAQSKQPPENIDTTPRDSSPGQPESIEPKAGTSPNENESYDTKVLDEKVREMARTLGKDENTYRMFIKENPDGSKLYRQIGMFVTIFPNDEEYFLPDEF